MRTEKVVKKETSDTKMPLKSKKIFTKKELNELTIKLAEVHGLI